MTWAPGFLLHLDFNRNAQIPIIYVFSIMNSLQGVFIFAFVIAIHLTAKFRKNDQITIELSEFNSSIQ